MKAVFIWDDENISHVARHGFTPDEVERVVQDPRNQFIVSRSSGRPGMVIRTRPRKRFMVFWDEFSDDPWTIRVTTMYET